MASVPRAGSPQPQTLFQGQSKTWILVVVKGDGTPFDLTGSTVELQVKKRDGAPDPPLIFLDNAGNGGITLLTQSGATEGRANVKMVPTDSTGLSGPHRLDVVVIDPSGDRHFVVPPSNFMIKAVVNPV